jgi:CheY-like chemotaxis protein
MQRDMMLGSGRVQTKVYSDGNSTNGAGSAKILVVDDEPGYRLMLQYILEEESGHRYTVSLAEDGKEAIHCLGEEEFDLIISDVYMPVMNGIRLHRTLREIPKYENLPFLFVSGYDDQYTIATVKNPKIEGFMRKGSPSNKLIEWVAYLTAPEDEKPSWPPVAT